MDSLSTFKKPMETNSLTSMDISTLTSPLETLAPCLDTLQNQPSNPSSREFIKKVAWQQWCQQLMPNLLEQNSKKDSDFHCGPLLLAQPMPTDGLSELQDLSQKNLKFWSSHTVTTAVSMRHLWLLEKMESLLTGLDLLLPQSVRQWQLGYASLMTFKD